MKNKLGYIGQKKPSDYTVEKYIAFPEHIIFKYYLKKIGCLPPVLLEMEIDLTDIEMHYAPFKFNFFKRKTFIDFMSSSQKSSRDELWEKAFEELEYIERMKEWR